MTFGEKLSVIQHNMGITQTELAGILGVSKQTLNRYIRGFREPSIRIAAQYANRLGISVDDLVDNKKSIAKAAPENGGGLDPLDLKFMRLIAKLSPVQKLKLLGLIDSMLSSKQ